ncbi:hypothetical protein ABPG74_007109 [Tetrahymena malaccensis]
MKVQYFPYVLTLALISVNCLEYMKIPQVETGYIKAVQFNSNPMTKSGFQQVNFSQTFQTVFTETPQILLSVCLLELDANKISHMDFQISTQEINTLQFKGIIEKKNDLNIHELHISYLAINNKNVYVKSGSFKFNKKVQNKEKWIIEKQFFQYSRKDFQPWNVTISVYVTGINKSFDSSITQLWNYQYLSIFTNVTYSNDSFQIIFKTQDKNIEEVYFNYIEIYQQNDNNYYEILSVIDDSINASFQNDESKVESFVNDLFNQPNDYNQISDDLTSQKIRTIPQYKVQINNINGIFYGLTGLKAELNPIYGKQDYCLQCNPSCKACEKTADNCMPCNKKQFIYNNQCFSEKPNNTYIDHDNILKDCNYTTHPYLFQESCFAKQPDKTFCQPDQNKFNCKSCPDQCQLCDEQRNCLKCTQNFPYFYQNDCHATQPVATLCEQNQDQFNCKSCPIGCSTYGGVTKKFEQLNIFQNQIQVERQCYNETLDQKFEYNQLPSSIIQNSGGFMFVSICILIFQVILVILAKSPLNHYIYKIYDLFISSFLIQFSQMLALVFWYSFLLQVEYMSSNNSMIGFTSYAFLIVSLLSVLAIIYLHGISLYSIHQKKLITGQSMIFILQQKMLNGIITENLYTRIVICLGYSISNAYSLRFLNRIIGSKQFDLPKAHYNNLFSNYTINNLCYVDKPYFLNDLSMYSYCKLNQRHHKKEKF